MINQLTSAATVSMDLNVEHRIDGAQVFAITPGVAMTINAVPDGLPGQEYVLIVTTSGTSSFVVTFGTAFKTTGTLATGTADAKVFVLRFVSKGSSVVEVSRTAAM
jgi:hypothetical protein